MSKIEIRRNKAERKADQLFQIVRDGMVLATLSEDEAHAIQRDIRAAVQSAKYCRSRTYRQYVAAQSEQVAR